MVLYPSDFLRRVYGNTSWMIDSTPDSLDWLHVPIVPKAEDVCQL